MKGDLEVSKHELGNWLVMNGWTPTRGWGSQRLWKKSKPSANMAAAHEEDADVSTTQGPQEDTARHRRWYIDFRDQRVPFSNLEIAKNVILVDRAANEPSLYWEFGCFIKLLNADKEKFHMGMWWQTHQPWYEKMQIEFDLHPLTLLPCRRNLARRPGIVKKTDCTEQAAANGNRTGDQHFDEHHHLQIMPCNNPRHQPYNITCHADYNAIYHAKRSGRYAHLRIHVNMWNAMAE